MTPAEHYAEAEKCLEAADQIARIAGEQGIEVHGLEHLISAAQVHATLATADDAARVLRHMERDGVIRR